MRYAIEKHDGAVNILVNELTVAQATRVHAVLSDLMFEIPEPVDEFLGVPKSVADQVLAALRSGGFNPYWGSCDVRLGEHKLADIKYVRTVTSVGRAEPIGLFEAKKFVERHMSYNGYIGGCSR